MRKIMMAALVAAAASLAACDNFSPPETADEAVETMPPEPVEPAPMPEPEPTPPVAAPPPTDNTALPPDQRTSEESVRPESETLFY